MSSKKRRRSRHDAALIGYWRKWYDNFFETHHQILVYQGDKLVLQTTPEKLYQEQLEAKQNPQRGVTRIQL